MPTDPEKLRQGWLGKDVHVTTVNGKALDGTLKGSDGERFVLADQGGLMLVPWSAVVAMQVVVTQPQEYNARAGEKPQP
jgi:hypothetical protein